MSSLCITMHLTAVLVIFGLMGTGGSRRTGTISSRLRRTVDSSLCGDDCSFAKHHENQYFTHLPDQGKNSVAPWELKPSPKSEGELRSIPQAVCTHCSVENMIAEPIKVKISVFKRVANGTSYIWCRCPKEVAVGCTCVRRQ